MDQFEDDKVLVRCEKRAVRRATAMRDRRKNFREGRIKAGLKKAGSFDQFRGNKQFTNEPEAFFGMDDLVPMPRPGRDHGEADYEQVHTKDGVFCVAPRQPWWEEIKDEPYFDGGLDYR